MDSRLKNTLRLMPLHDDLGNKRGLSGFWLQQPERWWSHPLELIHVGGATAFIREEVNSVADVMNISSLWAIKSIVIQQATKYTGLKPTEEIRIGDLRLWTLQELFLSL